MRAYARVTAQAVKRGGGTVLTELRGDSPLLLRRTHDEDGIVTVHLVGGAAGPLGGDELRLDVVVGSGAALRLRSVAASIALPGRAAAPSQFTVTARVASGGSLQWLPEPTVAAARCRHNAYASIDVAEEADLLWRDELICGRYAETPGSLTMSTSVAYAGAPLLRQCLRVGPDADGWAGPAVLGAAKATGSLLQVHPGISAGGPIVLGPTAVRTPLRGPATLTTVVADDAHALRAYLGRR
ncbi:MAG: urease accessory protein UreD [Hamadaea sp.]|uniref:urease accessory protein UreD n=1 Tax=Hamadaea sp. TaxID=2024425 RepID=UPI0017FDA040|nr:urease accessory protein UreD [Hamadaea sp.]NUR69478.1 urease accessory protein UreD [Hamadaea sp.]NUT20714.1 urease accessory protein UreD [Hamadaea sp.]